MQGGSESAAFFAAVQKADCSELLNLLHSTHLSPEKQRDQRGYCALHVIALNNNPEVAECLFTYIRNNYDSPSVIRQWVECMTDEGFTALHFAAFRGSLKLVKILIAEGADPRAKNKQGLNALHIAAQGDQPVVIAFLYEQGLDLNEKDSKGGAALHWAAYMGNEMSAAVLLSWDVEKDYPDSEGHTPLHLAAIAGNARITRNLLLKGANRHMLDIKGRRPLDIARDSKLKQMVEMLKVPGCLAECSIKPPVRPYRKSMLASALYLVGFPVSVILTVLFTVQCNHYSAVHEYGLAVYLALALLSLLFYAITALKDPGYLKKREGDTLLALFQRYEPYLVCPDCLVWRPARSRHCQCCDRCVEKFDHHCPWLSNCIGARNLGFFYLFLVFTQLSLVMSTVCGFLALTADRDSYLHVEHIVVEAVGAALGSLSALFLAPVSLLCLVQSQNFLANTTTNERFGNRKKEKDDELNSSTASMYVNRSSLMRNCMSMCCNVPTGELASKASYRKIGAEEELEDGSLPKSDTSQVMISE